MIKGIYTQVIPTVIAVLLAINTFKHDPVSTKAGVQKVELCDDSGTICAPMYSTAFGSKTGVGVVALNGG